MCIAVIYSTSNTKMLIEKLNQNRKTNGIYNNNLLLLKLAKKLIKESKLKEKILN